MNDLLNNDLVKDMIRQASKLVLNKGIKSRNSELLNLADNNQDLVVNGQRIYPGEDILNSCLHRVKKDKLTGEGRKCSNHDWKDMIINKGDDHEVIIKISDLPYQYCDIEESNIIPLTREMVIKGSKLIHVLSDQQGIKGYSCGVPQDTHDFLKAIEQYVIGFRYNRNGGGTIQSLPEEVETEFSKIRCIAEDWESPNQRDLMLFSPSPMIFDADDLYLLFREGISVRSIMVGSMPMMGMTGPVDPIGVYILGIAEIIGAATVLHALLPDTLIFLYPHPQAMSLDTGQMAFGTVEHARLEMMKIEVMDALELQYYNIKDIMTSSQMPGSMAQGDKALGFFTGIMAGFRAYNLMPLSTDQVWSPEQAILDIHHLQNALNVLDPGQFSTDFKSSYEAIEEVVDCNGLFAENAHTLLNMFNSYDTQDIYDRYYSSETWKEAGRPDTMKKVSVKKDELINAWNYRPPQHKLEKVIDIYGDLCKKLHVDPIDLDQ